MPVTSGVGNVGCNISMVCFFDCNSDNTHYYLVDPICPALVALFPQRVVLMCEFKYLYMCMHVLHDLSNVQYHYVLWLYAVKSRELGEVKGRF